MYFIELLFFDASFGLTLGIGGNVTTHDYGVILSVKIVNPNVSYFLILFCRHFGPNILLDAVMPAWYEKMNFINFRHPPLYENILGNSDLAERNNEEIIIWTVFDRLMDIRIV